VPTLADNVTLLAFAAAALGGRQCRPIDISCPPRPQQQTRRTGLQRAIGGTDRQTDSRIHPVVSIQYRDGQTL